ncbi:hypothetical protein RIF29_41810 [Crotalaria pallida]|uniref:Uncharacterized protein n=1 Tax=Crotalaria pallida TaxID=3830 RepID=A0AAN9E8R9_CROPI
MELTMYRLNSKGRESALSDVTNTIGGHCKHRKLDQQLINKNDLLQWKEQNNQEAGDRGTNICHNTGKKSYSTRKTKSSKNKENVPTSTVSGNIDFEEHNQLSASQNFVSVQSGFRVRCTSTGQGNFDIAESSSRVEPVSKSGAHINCESNDCPSRVANCRRRRRRVGIASEHEKEMNNDNQVVVRSQTYQQGITDESMSLKSMSLKSKLRKEILCLSNANIFRYKHLIYLFCFL